MVAKASSQTTAPGLTRGARRMVTKPVPALGDLFAPQTELPGPAAGIADGENGERVALAAGAGRAAQAMADDPLDHRAPISPVIAAGWAALGGSL